MLDWLSNWFHQFRWRRLRTLGAWVHLLLNGACVFLLTVIPAVFPEALSGKIDTNPTVGPGVARAKQAGGAAKTAPVPARRRRYPFVLWLFFGCGAWVFFNTLWEKRPTEAGTPNDNDQFRKHYTATLERAVSSFTDPSSLTKERIAKIRHGILVAIVGVVETYFGEDVRQKGKINANAMVPRPVAGKRPTDFPGAHFLDSKRELSSYLCMLEVIGWASEDHCSPDRFAVPVDSERERVLFGAPKAFRTKQTQVIPNIKGKNELTKLLKGQPYPVEQAVRTYFNSRTSFRSFVSVCLKQGDDAIGVLNIQSSQPFIFGDGERHRKKILEYIQPFCAILATLIQAEQSQAGAQGTPDRP